MSSNDHIVLCVANPQLKLYNTMAHLVLHPWSVAKSSSLSIHLNQYTKKILGFEMGSFLLFQQLQMPSNIWNVIKWFLCLNVSGILPIKYSLIKILNHQNLVMLQFCRGISHFYWTYYEWCNWLVCNMYVVKLYFCNM